jgi:hypothetical protein
MLLERVCFKNHTFEYSLIYNVSAINIRFVLCPKFVLNGLVSASKTTPTPCTFAKSKLTLLGRQRNPTNCGMCAKAIDRTHTLTFYVRVSVVRCRMRVGDVIGVTRYMSPTSWYGEVFNTAAKHEEGEFNPKLARHLTEEELDDLLIISKHGFLECNGKKMFMVLHGGQLFRYNDTPARDKTAKQLAKAQASMPIDESTHSRQCRQSQRRHSRHTAATARRSSSWVTARSSATGSPCSRRRLRAPSNRLTTSLISAPPFASSAYSKSSKRLSSRSRTRRGTSLMATSTASTSPTSMAAAHKRHRQQIDRIAACTAYVLSRSSSCSNSNRLELWSLLRHRRLPRDDRRRRPPDEFTEDSIIDGGVPMHHLFAVAPSFAEFLAPACYVSDADIRRDRASDARADWRDDRQARRQQWRPCSHARSAAAGAHELANARETSWSTCATSSRSTRRACWTTTRLPRRSSRCWPS